MGQNEDSPQATVTDAMVQQSLGNLFQKAGYETVYGGKVHLPPKMNNSEEHRLSEPDRRLTPGTGGRLCEVPPRDPTTKPFLLFASFINPHDICYMGINAHQRSNGGAATDNVDSKTCEAVLDRARQSGDLADLRARPLPPAAGQLRHPGPRARVHHPQVRGRTSLPGLHPRELERRPVAAAPLGLLPADRDGRRADRDRARRLAGRGTRRQHAGRLHQRPRRHGLRAQAGAQVDPLRGSRAHPVHHEPARRGFPRERSTTRTSSPTASTCSPRCATTRGSSPRQDCPAGACGRWQKARP